MSNIRRTLLCLLVVVGTLSVQAQNIKGHYVSKAEEDGTMYHTFPQTLFQSREYGPLTFDITYKDRQQGIATINFTYAMPCMTPADSIRIFSEGGEMMAGPVRKLYAEPKRKVWIHRYSFTTPVTPLYTFFEETALPEVTVYSQGRAYVFVVKRSAWRSYAPVGFRIFEMIRLNEWH